MVTLQVKLSLDRLVYLLAGGVGAILVLGATGFGLTVAAEQGYLVPSARVGFGLAICTVAWIASWHLRHRAPTVMGAIAGTAAGSLYAVLYAAHGMYDFISSSVAFGAMAAVTATAALHGLRTGRQGLAWVGLLGGLLAPLMVSSGDNRPVAFFGYLTILAAGSVFVAAKRDWPWLVWGAGVGLVLEYMGWVSAWHSLDQIPYGLAAAFVLALPFAVAGARHNGTTGKHALGWSLFMPMLAIPWLGPEVDPAYDDVSGMPLTAIIGAASLWIAIGMMVVPLPGLLALRIRAYGAAAMASGAVLAMLALVVTSWVGATPVPSVHVVLGALAPLAVTTALFARHPLTRFYDVMPLISGGVLFVLAASVGPEAPVMAGVVAVGALSVSAYRVDGSSWRLVAGLLGSGATLLTATATGAQDGDLGALVPATLVTLVLFGQGPLLLRRGTPRHVAFLTAAAASLVAYLPLHLAWVETWGDDYVGLLPLLLAGQALVGATMLVRTGEISRHGVELGAFAAMAMLGVTMALPLQLETSWLTVGLALKGAALAWLSTHVRHVSLWWGSAILGVVVGVRLLANPDVLAYGDATGMILLNWTLYTWGLPALALVASAWCMTRTFEEKGLRPAWVPMALVILATIEGFALVNMEISHAFRDAGPISVYATGLTEGLVRSLSWGLYGMSLLGVGLWRGVRALRFIGFAFVLLGAGRVFAVDLWSLQGFARVLSMLGIGVCLLVSAFVFERLVLRGASSSDDEETP